MGENRDMRFRFLLPVLVIGYLSSPLTQAAIEDKSLVLYLSFDEGKGKVAKDGTEYGHNAELVNSPKWVDGKVGKALEFKGDKNQYAMVPITDALQTTKTLSVAFWVKRGPTKDQIRDWNYMIGGGSLKWHVIFEKLSAKTFVWTKSGGTWAQKGVSDEVQPEDWVHIVVTHDTKANVSIYYDGKKAGGGPKPPVIDEIDGSFMIGARHPGKEFFTGVIDEVYLFNSVIKPDEIKKTMEDTLLPVQPGAKLATTWADIRHQQE